MKLIMLNENQDHTCKPDMASKPSGMGFAEFFKRAREECEACNPGKSPRVEPSSEEPVKVKKPVNRPQNVEELRKYVKSWSNPWEVYPNPGDLTSGDACPECGSVVKPKRKFIGVPKFIGCNNNHAFVIAPRKEKPPRVWEKKPLPPEKGAGMFGTGRPAGIKPSDSPVVQALKSLRDMGGSKWSRRGKGGGRRIREKDRCPFGHTCPPSPTGKDRDYPIIKDRELFDEITGAPLPEYLDYYLKKSNCPVCSGRKARCPNKVSSEFGRAKPFCSEHVMGSDATPYVQDLKKQVSDEPDPYEDYKESEASWRRIRGKLLEVGDKVKIGKRVGTLIGVDEKREGGDTHVVRWLNPKSAAKEITYNNPEKLDLSY